MTFFSHQIMGDFAKTSDFTNNDDDIDDNTNPLEVVEYVDDIYQYYWNMEVNLISQIVYTIFLF